MPSHISLIGTKGTPSTLSRRLWLYPTGHQDGVTMGIAFSCHTALWELRFVCTAQAYGHQVVPIYNMLFNGAPWEGHFWTEDKILAFFSMAALLCGWAKGDISRCGLQWLLLATCLAPWACWSGTVSQAVLRSAGPHGTDWAVVWAPFSGQPLSCPLLAHCRFLGAWTILGWYTRLRVEVGMKCGPWHKTALLKLWWRHSQNLLLT